MRLMRADGSGTTASRCSLQKAGVADNAHIVPACVAEVESIGAPLAGCIGVCLLLLLSRRTARDEAKAAKG
jgi:hypothetical protein